METNAQVLTAAALTRYQQLAPAAIRSVSERFEAAYPEEYARHGARWQNATREDLAYHLEFLRPVLQFGLMRPMVDYLRWLDDVLEKRAVPAGHLELSLAWLADFFEERMRDEDGAAVASVLRDARQRFLDARGEPQPAPQAPDAWPEAAAFETALLAGDQAAAMAIMNACLDRGDALVAIELHVVQPSLYHIGERWQASEVSVAQEHLATALAQSIMTAGLLRSVPAAPNGRRILIACVEGNKHAVGSRMVADAFQLAGWSVQHLGADVPTAALVQQVEAWRPDLVGLSVSFAHQLRVVKAVITGLAERLGDERPAVMIGGLAINQFAPLAGMMGADGASVDAGVAVRDADRLGRSRSSAPA